MHDSHVINQNGQRKQIYLRVKPILPPPSLSLQLVQSEAQFMVVCLRRHAEPSALLQNLSEHLSVAWRAPLKTIRRNDGEPTEAPGLWLVQPMLFTLWVVAC